MSASGDTARPQSRAVFRSLFRLMPEARQDLGAFTPHGVERLRIETQRLENGRRDLHVAGRGRHHVGVQPGIGYDERGVGVIVLVRNRRGRNKLSFALSLDAKMTFFCDLNGRTSLFQKER